MSAALVEYSASVPGWADPRVSRCADGLLRFRDLTPSLTELLDISVHRYADREAVCDVGGERMTYRELWTSASRVAGGLQMRGISIGDRVAIRYPNGVRWVQAFLGVLLSGAVPVPVDHELTESDAAHVLADSEADFVLDDELPYGLPFIDDGACLDELALLCYTRGTTGKAKGVELSNENLLSAIESVLRIEKLGFDKLDALGARSLMLLPLSHASGCVDRLLPTLAAGGTLVLAPGATPDRLAALVGTERVDTITASPDDYRSALATLSVRNGDTAGVRRICCPGGSLEPEETAALQRAFPAARHWSWWGATETSGIGLTMPEHCASDHPGHVGIAFGGTEIALWGADAEEGRGELLCRGPHVMRGYWNNAAATARTFTGNWFHTGDSVEIDGDGFVRVVGRVSSTQ